MADSIDDSLEKMSQYFGRHYGTLELCFEYRKGGFYAPLGTIDRAKRLVQIWLNVKVLKVDKN